LRGNALNLLLFLKNFINKKGAFMHIVMVGGLIGLTSGAAIGGAIGYYQEKTKRGLICGGIAGVVAGVALSVFFSIAVAYLALAGIGLSLINLFCTPLYIAEAVLRRYNEQHALQPLPYRS
jgi:uncharacterized membrane protein (UPF0136 family)